MVLYYSLQIKGNEKGKMVYVDDYNFPTAIKEALFPR